MLFIQVLALKTWFFGQNDKILNNLGVTADMLSKNFIFLDGQLIEKKQVKKILFVNLLNEESSFT